MKFKGNQWWVEAVLILLLVNEMGTPWQSESGSLKTWNV